ncbi:armadillo repeat-containing protein 6 homolog [Condylostylus longicornis]|uniref:armadillo repeat-containing protein 6 homolog n=1 Tax=Condylostylus longicornis TaxID=2530218 RepID=UPI00244E0EA1|nr:armadillo repeat-containing protein 6 homolog [Condylostylus longicornis]
MAKFISQETFDDVVRENIIEFSMSPNEAREETIKQFEAQDINLANIIKDLTINDETGVPILNECIHKLKSHIDDGIKLNENDLIENLKILESECKKSIPHRVMAAKHGAHEILLKIIENELNLPESSRNIDLMVYCLNAKTALTNKYPDIFDDKSLKIVIKILDTHKNEINLISATLQYLPKACVLHEINRQNIMNANIMNYTKPLVKNPNGKVVKDLCTLYRSLILDDDIRVEFGKAHEHARQIASEVLIDLTKILSEHDDVNVLSDLILTIASLVVRQEFCIAVEEEGGLEQVFNLMNKFPNEVKLNREALKLLRALGGHDQVKNKIVQKGAPPIIYNILDSNKENESVTANALACVSTLTLRVKENSAAFFETGIAEVIIESMKIHPKSKIVQRNAAWAIRNMVSRSREQCEHFLSFGAEELLNAALQEFPAILHDVKSALRDLGCKVDLKEEWTGKAEIKIAN